MKKSIPVFFLLLSGALAYGAFGDPKPTSPEAENIDPLTAVAHLQPSMVEVGGTTNLTIDLDLLQTYHAYVERFKLQIEAPDDLHLANFKITPAVKFFDKLSNSTQLGMRGKAKLKALIEVPKGFKAGVQSLKLKLVYQACTEDHCLFPKTINLTLPLTVKP